MKILTFSTLFPNAEKPGHGIFVETRLRHLVASGQVEARGRAGALVPAQAPALRHLQRLCARRAPKCVPGSRCCTHAIRCCPRSA
ncbi:hypothetical protein LP419_18565 [Massilia sp. H-1]|nr:hypothetical protein LP419_18565 [Massilia sp. H-1]